MRLRLKGGSLLLRVASSHYYYAKMAEHGFVAETTASQLLMHWTCDVPLLGGNLKTVFIPPANVPRHFVLAISVTHPTM